MSFFARLTLWGWLVLALTAAASVGWILLLNDWYRERRAANSFPYQAGGKFWATLMVAFPFVFFVGAYLLLGRFGVTVVRDDPAAESEQKGGKGRVRRGKQR